MKTKHLSEDYNNEPWRRNIPKYDPVKAAAEGKVFLLQKINDELNKMDNAALRDLYCKILGI